MTIVLDTFQKISRKNMKKIKQIFGLVDSETLTRNTRESASLGLNPKASERYRGWKTGSIGGMEPA